MIHLPCHSWPFYTWNAACDLISEIQNKTVCCQQLCYPHSYKNLICVFCDTAALGICRQHLPCGDFPVLSNQHGKYSCLWTVIFKDDLRRTMWKLTQWLKIESCLFIIRCRGMIIIAGGREWEQESNRKQEVCRNLVSQFWGLTLLAFVGRLSELASKHMCGCQWGSKQGVMIVWSLDFICQCVFRMNAVFESEPVCPQHRGWWCPQPFVSKRTIRIHLPSCCWDDGVSYYQIILCVLRYSCCCKVCSKTLRHSEPVCLDQWMSRWYVKSVTAVGTP